MSMEELALQIKHMETQMNLLRQAHDEERKELNNTISTLEANVKEQRDVESRLTHLELSLSQSWENKDVLRGTSNRYISGESDNMTEGAEHEMTMLNVGGREQAITLTFGDIDTKPTTLERFISHYKVVNEINTERQVKVWKKPSYRALTLRMALRGPPAEFIEQEANMQQEWVKDDAGILGKLRDRYIKNTAVELHIIAFESASQKEGEPLAEYMTRLQKLIGNAYPEYPEWVRRSRTVWQFLNGARDKDVREELITKGWMKDGKDSKEYEEILKIAEGVINKKKVTKATGKVGYENQVNTVVGRSRTSTPGYVRNRRISNNAGNSTPGANWNCFCCKTDEHPGGWRKCPQLGKLYPDWKLGDRPPIFQ